MDKPCRKNIRLASWDYGSNATYHVTICTANKQAMFGCVVNHGSASEVSLSRIGELCKSVIEDEAVKVDGLQVDNYVIMPNHVHLLLSLSEQCNLRRVINRLKSRVTKLARSEDSDFVVWQRGYHEHIIRNETDCQAVWEYIDANPAKWIDDELYVR